MLSPPVATALAVAVWIVGAILSTAFPQEPWRPYDAAREAAQRRERRERLWSLAWGVVFAAFAFYQIAKRL